MKPRNTTAEVQRDPLAGLITGFPGGIERQEAAGQSELVKSESLPADCRGRDALEAAGVKFGPPYSDDPIFVPATLPAGWKKQATDHSMWSHLLDEKGRKRASIFYKAAFYDRSAHMHVDRRYSYSAYEDGADERHLRVVVKDGDQVVHVIGEYARNDWNASRDLEKQAGDWLKEHFPEWESAAAYWD